MKQHLVFLLFFFVGGFSFAQSAEDIDYIFDQPVISWNDVCVWTFACAGQHYSERDAAFYAEKLKVIPEGAKIETPADLAGLALLIMRAYNLHGGIFYSMFQNRRYAFREMVYFGIFNRTDDPNDTLSGARFLSILSCVDMIIHGKK